LAASQPGFISSSTALDLACRFKAFRIANGTIGCELPPARRPVRVDDSEWSPIWMTSPLSRAEAFCERFGLEVPILLAPMAGACPPSLSIAVANAGGMAAAGLLLHSPDAIRQWMEEFRASSNGAVQLNTWIPDPAPVRDPEHERRLREFLGKWGPPVSPDAGDAPLQDFAAQCEAMLAVSPPILSSVMGLYPSAFVARMKERGIAWFAVVSTVSEAIEAEAAGADVIIAQGAEAGGHRAAFDANGAERRAVGLLALVPAVVDAVRVPVVATGGIADGRGVAAALTLGASAAQVGTAFLRCPEAKTNPAWADALARTRPEDTMITRAFSGRAGRSVATKYTLTASAPDAPTPAPYPIQRGLTAAMRDAGANALDVQRMQAWAGQSAALGRAEPAGDVVRRLWADARALLPEP
jgi:nitronate monooxygenase